MSQVAKTRNRGLSMGAAKFFALPIIAQQKGPLASGPQSGEHLSTGSSSSTGRYGQYAHDGFPQDSGGSAHVAAERHFTFCERPEPDAVTLTLNDCDAAHWKKD